MQKKTKATRARSPIAPTTAPMTMGVVFGVFGEVLEEAATVLEVLEEEVLVGFAGAPEARTEGVSFGAVVVRELPAAMSSAWDSEKVGSY